MVKLGMTPMLSPVSLCQSPHRTGPVELFSEPVMRTPRIRVQLLNPRFPCHSVAVVTGYLITRESLTCVTPGAHHAADDAASFSAQEWTCPVSVTSLPETETVTPSLSFFA